ncbi:hypothetical protein DFJ77DRAFT_511613 [Powellomyces hirtus]|nr:hypothetical protein DFJ77DRAFT_511613 [Powellomyces hirtus]
MKKVGKKSNQVTKIHGDLSPRSRQQKRKHQVPTESPSRGNFRAAAVDNLNTDQDSRPRPAHADADPPANSGPSAGTSTTIPAATVDKANVYRDLVQQPLLPASAVVDDFPLIGVSEGSPAHAVDKSQEITVWETKQRHRLDLAAWHIADAAVRNIPQICYGTDTFAEVHKCLPPPAVAEAVIGYLNLPDKKWANLALAALRGQVTFSRSYWPFDPEPTLPTSLVLGIVEALSVMRRGSPA